jgi:hypothetical protein
VKLMLAIGFVVLSGCAVTAPFECDDRDWREPGLTCQGVRTAAQRQLIGVPGVTGVTAHQGSCPPGSWCPLVSLGATVVADLIDGSQLWLVVTVGESDTLTATRPQQVGQGEDR